MTRRPGAVRVVTGLLLVGLLAAAFVIVSTAVRYADGTERLPDVGFGYPSRESGNLDREFRVFPQLGGCSGSMLRSGARRIERATFVALVRAFGPTKGTYRGPYPTRDEAGDILRVRASNVSQKEWLSRAFEVRGRSVLVPPAAMSRVEPPPNARLDVALVGPCLVIGFERGATREIHLVDLDGTGWFAVYRYG